MRVIWYADAVMQHLRRAEEELMRTQNGEPHTSELAIRKLLTKNNNT